MAQTMRNFSPTAQKVFNHAKAHPGLSIYGLAKALKLDYKSTYVAVAMLEKYELLRTESKLQGRKARRDVFVPSHAKDLDITKVQLESGKKLLSEKEKRRKAYFEKHGSMTLSANSEIKLKLNSSAFDF